MKKLIQITFTTVLFLSLNVQFIYSQFYSDPAKKVEKLIKSNAKNDLVKFSRLSVEIQQSDVLTKDVKNLPEYPEKNQGMSPYYTDLFATDEEEQIQVEKWMLNPCGWLCKE